MPLASQSPYHIIVYIVWPTIDPILVSFGQMFFFRSQLYSHFLFIYLINPLNTLLFTYSTNILVRFLTVNMKNFLTRKFENVQPHSSTSIENETLL